MSGKRVSTFLDSDGNQIETTLAEEHVEEINEIKDSRGISRSRLLRQWIYAGWKLDNDTDLEIVSSDSANARNSDPYKAIFIESLPEEEENAMALNELKKEILDDVESEIMRLYREYDGLSMSNGLVYRDE